MNELNTILELLKKIKTISQRKVKLTENQKKRLDTLPSPEQNTQKTKLLRPKKELKKDILRVLTTELANKIKESDLPDEIISKILDAIKQVNESQNIKQKITNLTTLIKENIRIKEEIKPQEEHPQNQNILLTPTTPLFIPTLESDDSRVLPPFVRIRYTKEKYEKATQNYFHKKILPELVEIPKKPIVPVEPKREYPKKQGSMYPKNQIELENKHKKAWEDLLVDEIQKEQTKAGTPPTKPEEILASFENLPNMKKKLAIKALKLAHPELAQKQAEEEKKAYELQLKKNLERQRRKREIKLQKKAEQKVKNKSQTLRKRLENSQEKNSEGLLNRLEQTQKNYPTKKRDTIQH